MKPAQARVFLEGVLLDAIREDIRENRNKGNRVLHPHYYEALKRAVYKPGAFFKGIVFPLLEASTSSLSASPKTHFFADRLLTQGGCYHRIRPC
jgi:essential nuclear protein 1